MQITIIHPSRGRAAIAKSVYDTWMSKADNPDEIQYIVSLDWSDSATGTYMSMFEMDNLWTGNPAIKTLYSGNLFMTVEHNNSAIDAINNAAKLATGEILMVVSDDFDCPQHWDTLLLEAIAGRTDFVAKTDDGIQKTLITLPIMDRTYYQRFGYIYHPGYRHMFSDQEMTAVGHMLGKVITLPVQFTHNHYSTGRFAKDDISERNDATWDQGKELFRQRLQTNFGIEAPVIPYSSIVWH